MMGDSLGRTKEIWKPRSTISVTSFNLMFLADNIALEKTVTPIIFMCQSAAFVKDCPQRPKGTETASILRVR